MNGTEIDDSSLLTENCLPELLRAFANEIQDRPSDTAAAYMRRAADEIERIRAKLRCFESNEMKHLNCQLENLIQKLEEVEYFVQSSPHSILYTKAESKRTNPPTSKAATD